MVSISASIFSDWGLGFLVVLGLLYVLNGIVVVVEAVVVLEEKFLV